MKRIIFCFLLLFCCVLFSADFVFADKGKANYEIVLPDKSVGFEKQAAEDLKTFFNGMSGASFNIIPESQSSGKNCIFIGNTAFARKNGIDVSKLSAETWVIKTSGKNLILSGGQPIGAFYAVWELLHKLDCYSLTLLQDAVPKRPRLACEVKDIQKKPAFEGRRIGDGTTRWFALLKTDKKFADAYHLWMLRNGQNGGKGRDKPLWRYGAHNISHRPESHSLSLYVHPDLFKTHPEYFAMNEHGERCKPLRFAYRGSVCMTNKDVKKHTLNSLRAMIKKDRSKLPKEKWPKIYDISTLDATLTLCLCPECKKIIDYEGSQTGLLLHYINHIATEIRKEYPEIIIRTFGYGPSVNPPQKILPADNVMIFLTDNFVESDPYRPLTHPVNAKRLEIFKKWQKTTNRLMVWDYWNLGVFYKPPQPATVINALVPDFKFFREIGVSDMFIETGRCWHASQSFIDLVYFVGSQLLIDPDQDVERLINIYFEHYYGPAAVEMRKIFDHIRAGVMQHKNRQTCSIVGHWSYMTPEFMYDSYAVMKKLASSLPQPYKQRVEDELISFVWYAVAQRYTYRAIFKKHGIDLDKTLPQECRQLVKKHIARFGGKDFRRAEKEFAESFKTVDFDLRRPEKFKDIPDENFRIIGYPHFYQKALSKSLVVDDPDSIQGKALRSANPDPRRHGVDKVVLKNYRTTYFRWGNHRVPGGVQLRLRQVPQDEKYHWYRMPGKLELKGISYFWGHAWAVQATTTHLFQPVIDDPLSNIWDEVWFSAKFTGPAYVKGSKKENAIYVDMAVLVKRPENKKK